MLLARIGGGFHDARQGTRGPTHDAREGCRRGGKIKIKRIMYN